MGEGVQKCSEKVQRMSKSVPMFFFKLQNSPKYFKKHSKMAKKFGEKVQKCAYVIYEWSLRRRYEISNGFRLDC